MGYSHQGASPEDHVDVGIIRNKKVDEAKLTGLVHRNSMKLHSLVTHVCSEDIQGIEDIPKKKLIMVEQDAAYRAALEADQARERQRREEEERLAKEAAEAERKRKEEEEARERAAREAAEKQAALAKISQEKAQSLGEEPEKGPNVTQVLVRFPNGVCKERRFNSSDNSIFI